MGRIKTKLVKRTGNDLIRENPTDFRKTFDENKKIVDSHAEVSSKKIRNTIAGFVTRKIKNRK